MLWLNQSAKALGGASPMSCLDTKAGVDAVRDLIGRLEHGLSANPEVNVSIFELRYIGYYRYGKKKV